MNPAGADSSHGGENSPCPQQPHRNMVLRAHHWGPSGHSAPDREAPRVCRYFQRGFCFRGDRCSYWHLVPTSPLEWGRRYSEPLVTRPGPWPGLTRRASEPTFPPSVVVDWGQGWLGARWGMELGLEEAGGSSWRSLSSSSAAWEPSLAQEPQPGSDPVGELSGALQSLDLAEGRGDSRDVVCGICRERVWEKPAAERAFGILPNCSHAHCLRCLRTWRRTPRLPLDVIKACPQCRVYSSYIIPYKFWVSEGPEKEQLIRTFTARTRSSAGSSCGGMAAARSDPTASTCTSSRSRPWPLVLPGPGACNWLPAVRCWSQCCSWGPPGQRSMCPSQALSWSPGTPSSCWIMAAPSVASCTGRGQDAGWQAFPLGFSVGESSRSSTHSWGHAGGLCV
ncbi:probable E3 ubiquitin-protein ligase makorin-1 isoform X2 [Heterocephalus glaber]|uniref:RING-type E3 ubiquitin transferase n=1 Tax=Heterocephalus glaber TaxID=10181 RepID=A0AAX6T6S0_HETGA|nr:probable E3 ubiquitin-protein ligase makorin-1 isoform X2 [Heterocephalus glaber]